MAQIAGGTIAVVRQGLHHHGDAVGAVSFIGDAFIIVLLTTLRLFNDALDVVVRHVQAFCFRNQIAQFAVDCRVRAARFNAYSHLASDFGKNLRALSVSLFFFALDVIPFTMP